MKAALLVNPYDGEEIADAMHVAREMRPQERRSRHDELMTSLNEYDVGHWRREFVAALAAAPGWRRGPPKPR
jgi:trehalose 6-phosphate synthase